MTRLASIESEIALGLSYPQTFLTDLNARANSFFSERLGADLGSRLKPDRPQCLGNVLGTAPVPLASWCGIGHIERAIHLHHRRAPSVVGLSYTSNQSLERELFVVHAAGGNGTSEILFLPFPASMRLTIQDESARNHHDFISGELKVPSAISVHVPGLLSKSVYTISDIRGIGAWERLEAAWDFYRLLLGRLDSDTLGASWDRAIAAYQKRDPKADVLIADIPESFARIFLPDSGCTPSDARGAIGRIWTRPLDAPVLSNFVYPKILKILDQDYDLDLAPAGPDEERDKYFRLHLPLKEIVAQSRYLAWLPNTRANRYLRHLTRSDVFSPS
jgi:hypothetical protein